MALALSLLYAFLMLLLPVAEALYNNRSPGALLYLYWVESCALLIAHSLRIVVHQRWTNATGHRVGPRLIDERSTSRRKKTKIAASASRFTFLASFMPMIAIFTVAHGVFILLLVFVFKVIGPVNPNDMYAATIWGAGVPLGMLIVDLFTLKRWPFTRLQNTVGTLGLRILVTQFGVIFGMVATAMTGSPWGVIAVFFMFRVLTDAMLDWSKRTNGKLGLSSWLARWVAKKENKSVEQVRAEFDAAMKEDREIGADVLNTPFDEGLRLSKQKPREST
jgi:Family of unknown function (DUF6498)